MSVARNLFISYCHADRKHLDQLCKHLAPLQRNGCISEWTDKELVVGDKLDKEVIDKLNDAEIIAFLISPDFLSSYYCYDIEFKTTIEKLDKYQLRVVPIIVEACDWLEDKLISQFVAAPPDGKPISLYENNNLGWLEVVNQIKIAIKKYNDQAINSPPAELRGQNGINIEPAFSLFLNNTEIEFSHGHKQEVYLSDIFVYPDLKQLIDEYDKLDPQVHAKKLSNYDKLDKKTLILGAEQTGKSALAKTLFQEYYNQNCLPLYVPGALIKKTDLNIALLELVKNQYGLESFSDYQNINRKKIIIIDDLKQIKLNERYFSAFKNNIENTFDNIILFADESFKYSESDFINFNEYAQYELLNLGHQRRYELISKWNSLGREEIIPEKELQTLNDQCEMHVNSIIRKNVVPPKPVFVLIILQSLEFNKQHDVSLTSYGHCYQYLIYQSLDKVNVNAKEIDSYLNYLTELAFFIYENNGISINLSQFGNFKSNYSSRFITNFSHEEIIQKLVESKILIVNDIGDNLQFGYKYIFYFYVAKKLAETIRDKNTINIINNICENIHTEQNANILIFLSHHSRDQSVIDHILLYTSSFFEKSSESTLDTNDTNFFAEFLSSIPNLVMETRSVEQERQKKLQRIDEEERKEQSSDYELDREIFSEINGTARAIEVIGQILRNRHGSLTRDQLNDLAGEAYSVGLRFLEFYLTLANKIQSDIEDLIVDLIKDEEGISDKDVIKRARKLFLSMCYGVSFSVIYKISTSIGSDKLLEIYSKLSQDKNTPAYKLIEVAINLEFTKKIPKKKIHHLYEELQGNPIARRLLQEIVLQHSYLHYLEEGDKQWISDQVGISMGTQRAVERKRATKKLEHE